MFHSPRWFMLHNVLDLPSPSINIYILSVSVGSNSSLSALPYFHLSTMLHPIHSMPCLIEILMQQLPPPGSRAPARINFGQWHLEKRMTNGQRLWRTPTSQFTPHGTRMSVTLSFFEPQIERLCGSIELSLASEKQTRACFSDLQSYLWPHGLRFTDYKIC